MKNSQKGFAVPLIIAIVALIAIGVGIYAYNNKKSADTANNENVVASQANKKDLTDEQVVVALNATFASQNKTKYQYQNQKDSQGKSIYGVSVDNGFNKVDAIYKGDLNNDGYSDSLVWVSSCSTDNDCAHGLRLVINNKNGTGVETTNFQTPDTISGWSGSSTVFDAVKIEDGIVSITSSSFYSTGDWKTATKLLKQTKKFQLQGSKLVEIKDVLKTYTDTKYGFEFQYPSYAKVIDEGTNQIGASLSLVVLAGKERNTSSDEVTLRVYEVESGTELYNEFQDNGDIKIVRGKDFIIHVNPTIRNNSELSDAVKASIKIKR